VLAGVTAGYSCVRGSQASESLAQTARSGMPGTPALTVSGLTGEFPGSRDRLAPQERGDQQSVAPAVQQAPGAGDRGSGNQGRDYVGCSLQRPPKYGRTAIRRGCRRPGHGYRFPPSRAADGTGRVLMPPVPAGQLHLLLREPLVVMRQGTT
jgi:hypothetical protein